MKPTFSLPALEDLLYVNFSKDLWYNARDEYYFYSTAVRKNSFSYDWEIMMEKLKRMLISVAAKGG